MIIGYVLGIPGTVALYLCKHKNKVRALLDDAEDENELRALNNKRSSEILARKQRLSEDKDFAARTVVYLQACFEVSLSSVCC